MMGVRYMICHWAINRTDPQNSLSTTLDIPLHHLPTSCPCSKAKVQFHEHIIMECDLYNPSTRPCNIIINSFIHFLTDNPGMFSFNNRSGSVMV